MCSKHVTELVLALPLVLAIGNRSYIFLVVRTSVVLLWYFNLILSRYASALKLLPEA